MNLNSSASKGIGIGSELIFITPELSNFQALAISAIFLTLYFYYYYCKFPKNQEQLNKFFKVPVVPGSLPVIGHGIYFLRGFKEFIQDCCKKHGGIFQIQVFRKTLIVICDQKFVRGYFKQKEEKLSLTTAMKKLNYDWCFYGEPTDLQMGLLCMRKSCSILPQDVIPKIEGETFAWIQKIRQSCQNSTEGKFKIDLEAQVFRCITKTSFYALTSLRLTENILDELESFFKILDGAIISSYFMPTWLSQLAFNWKLRPIRESLVKQIDPVLKGQDQDQEDFSALLKNAMKYEEYQSSSSTAAAAAACFLISFLYVSGTNTCPALVNLLTLLAMPENQQVLEELRQECQNDDIDHILKSPLLNACILEMTRLCSNIFTNIRSPTNEFDGLENYAIHNNKDVDIVISGQMIAFNANFQNPTKFDPYRFLGNDDDAEAAAKNIILWGGGPHECPGKKFALLELKIALTHLILNFDFNIIGKVPELDYFVPAFFAKRKKVEMIVTERNI